MILYKENPKDTTKKTNEFSKVAGYKINLQKSVAFLSSNNELSERRNEENNRIYHCIKKNKIPRNKSNQRGKRPVLREL